MAVWKRTHILLADGWYEVPGQSPREIRRARPGSGVLQLSYLPPRAEVPGSDEEVDDAPTDVLAKSVDPMGLGEPLDWPQVSAVLSQKYLNK